MFGFKEGVTAGGFKKDAQKGPTKESQRDASVELYTGRVATLQKEIAELSEKKNKSLKDSQAELEKLEVLKRKIEKELYEFQKNMRGEKEEWAEQKRADISEIETRKEQINADEALFGRRQANLQGDIDKCNARARQIAEDDVEIKRRKEMLEGSVKDAHAERSFLRDKRQEQEDFKKHNEHLLVQILSRQDHLDDSQKSNTTKISELQSELKFHTQRIDELRHAEEAVNRAKTQLSDLESKALAQKSLSEELKKERSDIDEKNSELKAYESALRMQEREILRREGIVKKLEKQA